MTDVQLNEFQLHELLVRDGIELIDLPLSKLLLMNDSQYPWFVLVPRVENIKDIYQLDWEQQQQLLNESSMLSEILMELFQGDKINVAALGNVCPQLHMHHIVRFVNDPAWPKPIWGELPMRPYTEIEIEQLKAKVLPSIEAVLANN
ncbi:HIT domain-containing protein [Thalassotalea euphylliae]|uniref:HIT domain-containing protein n=1 Tax=Thalassotalea euphylliae TaxID=1655234 RepID=A0A3E0UJR7_9GAMM|nr:HIT domain-containing protein [Thalassotalea euphylliae]REL36012.1 HIT domain-containing protein [Thalassotalea euphylliae]